MRRAQANHGRVRAVNIDNHALPAGLGEDGPLLGKQVDVSVPLAARLPRRLIVSLARAEMVRPDDLGRTAFGFNRSRPVRRNGVLASEENAKSMLSWKREDDSKSE